ncbi:hypothetical protein EJB05_08341, partial [Eragrostis curvula]
MMRELHPLCCGGGECAGSPPSPSEPAPPSVAGVLYKWTNIGKGWRPRWFAVRGAVLAYSKIRRRSSQAIGVVHLKISSFRESKSDDRRFYIITPTKTLQLRTHSADDRVAWIQALISARAESSQTGDLSCRPNGASFSTSRLLVLNADDTANISEPPPHLMESEYSCSRHGKCSERSSTESSDDIEQQGLDELLDQADYQFYDTRESFSDSAASPDLKMKSSNSCEDNCLGNGNFVEQSADVRNSECIPLYLKRRTKLPKPVEKESGISLWSMIKDNVGKDLTRVCLPVYFNEPLSSLQKCFEDLEYSYLLDRAYEFGRKGNSLMRILNVAAFAVSGYASSDGRSCKPFNPLLGETYEADYPENGIRFFSEKVSHHPMVMACHSEGSGWKFWGDSNIESKFWGQTIQLDPVGVLTLEFDDGETLRWSKVTTTINNLIIGRVHCHHHGTMTISGNKEYSCKLTFKQQSFLERKPRQVHGLVKDVNGATVANLMGRWDESMYCTTTTDASRVNCSASSPNADITLLWEKNEPSANPTRYNLSSFAITLNELTPELKEKLPPTDSRLRPDQRHLENGEYGKANAEKLRLETRQRMARNMQENGWKPRWFQRDTEDGTFYYTGGYWEAREQGKWDDCRDIFGESSDSRKLKSFQSG